MTRRKIVRKPRKRPVRRSRVNREPETGRIELNPQEATNLRNLQITYRLLRRGWVSARGIYSNLGVSRATAYNRVRILKDMGFTVESAYTKDPPGVGHVVQVFRITGGTPEALERLGVEA